MKPGIVVEIDSYLYNNMEYIKCFQYDNFPTYKTYRYKVSSIYPNGIIIRIPDTIGTMPVYIEERCYRLILTTKRENNVRSSS